jgi:LPS export ABC transporter protein LptC
MDMSGGLEVDFYEGQQGVKVSRLKAKEGTRDLKKGLLEARGQVVANNLAGDTLYAETLRMDERSGRVSSTGAVRIRTPREWLVGEGLEANRDLSEYRILRLKGTLKLKS